MNKYIYRLCYYKKGNLKYVSFKDFSQFLIRALRRTSIPVLYSQGFNPQPLLSFSIPVPVGVESRREWLDISLYEKVPEDFILREWNKELTPDVQFYECYFLGNSKNSLKVKHIKYEMELFHPSLELLYNDLKEFYLRHTFNILVRRGERIKEIDLRKYLENLNIENKENVIINVLVKVIDGGLIRGEEILEIFSYKPLIINQIRELLIDV
ncbi:MAG: TIGR03936 family radical SAM-associated protein [Dictyoglomaceae bacterium]